MFQRESHLVTYRSRENQREVSYKTQETVYGICRFGKDLRWSASKGTVVDPLCVGLPEWLVKVVQAMYVCARSRTRVNSSFSEKFEVKVGVHQGSVLSPLLFIVILEALSREFRVGCPWEMLYTDHLVILAEMFEGLMTKMAVWKNGLESKGLKVNMGTTKVMISGRDPHTSYIVNF